LKPDVLPPPTEVGDGSTVPASNIRRHARRALLPCENDQAKPDRFSRLARSTNLSKIRVSYPPERSPFGSRPGVAPGCPRTCCADEFAYGLYRTLRRFCANLLNLLIFLPHVKLKLAEGKTAFKSFAPRKNLNERPAYIRLSR